MESYEKGIPKVLREKIEEDKEVKFDPKCVEVLIEALPEVREVLKRLNPEYKPDKE